MSLCTLTERGGRGQHTWCTTLHTHFQQSSNMLRNTNKSISSCGIHTVVWDTEWVSIGKTDVSEDLTQRNIFFFHNYQPRLPREGFLWERCCLLPVQENVILGHHHWRWSGEQMLQSSQVYLHSQYTHTVTHWASCSGKGSWPSTTALVGQETFLKKTKKQKQNISRK